MTERRRQGTAIRQYHGEDKIVTSLDMLLERVQVKDGMTVSFHHHFREGDVILNSVMDALAERGVKGLKLFASSLGKVHDPIVAHIENGVISEIHTSGLRGGLAKAISEGKLEKPVIIRSHGGRARSIESGEMKIDVAFLAVPSSDHMGNANGMGPTTKCGSLGYAMVDAAYADRVVLFTDHITAYPNMPAHIRQDQVDHIVLLDNIGDPNGIASGATRYTKNPKELKIAQTAADVIKNLPYFKDGFSFQTGSGGASLAVSRYLEQHMVSNGIKASFALGGITQPIVEMHEKGLIGHLFDVQSFDLVAADSAFNNPNHHVISASEYANPDNMGCVASQLDYVVLSALEVDTDFNVNVMTGSDGVIMGASGGHCDTAQSAKCTIIVAPLFRGRLATVIDRVTTIITPGHTVDILVTERGVAVNPSRRDIIKALENAGMQLRTIDELKKEVEGLLGVPEAIGFTEHVVAKVEYRDGSIVDTIRRLGANHV